jgi:hypothetical protein
LPPWPSSSNTGPGGDDLSISELSLSDVPEPGPSQPFNLIAAVNPPKPQPRHEVEDNPFEDDRSDDEGETTVQQAEKQKILTAKLREEKLQHDLFILRKMNASFAVYNDALRNVESVNDVCIVSITIPKLILILNFYR